LRENRRGRKEEGKRESVTAENAVGGSQPSIKNVNSVNNLKEMERVARIGTGCGRGTGLLAARRPSTDSVPDLKSGRKDRYLGKVTVGRYS
jgi:hypothetical protein